ncbi:MAG TPA: X2-like carbohydrate binding domain-containing protein, partial [Clostridia bacterium]
GEVHGFIWENGKMTDLSLPGSNSRATAINENSQVIGYCSPADGSQHWFIWKNGEVTYLENVGTSFYATAINNKGQVIGYYVDKDRSTHGFIWENGDITDLGTLGGNTNAIAINDNSQVIGYSYLTNGSQHGFIWEDGKMTDLGSLGGSASYASAINNRGQVVGYSNLSSGKQHGFIWEDGKMTDLGSLGDFSCAQAINENGQVVGSTSISGSESDCGFIWENGRMIALGAPNPNSYYSYAIGIDNNGQVIGGFSDLGNTERHGAIWKDGKITDLGINMVCVAINERGYVVGNYYIVNDIINKISHGFILAETVPVIIINPYDTQPTNKDITVTASVYDGTLNETSHAFIQNGSFTFTATNEACNTVSKTITITNIDKTPPNIKLCGNPVKYLTSGEPYIDEGAQASDNVDGDITSRISVSGSVYTNVPATYILKYSVFDKAGNEAIPVTRTVIVTPSNTITAGFDLSSPADVRIIFSGNGKLLSIKNGPTDLTRWDFDISGNMVTIKKSYLTYFFTKFNSPSQKLNLTLEFDTGNNPVLTVGRIFAVNMLSASCTVFDPSNPQNITVTLVGNPLKSLKNGPTDLTKWDYSLSGNILTIKKSYLTYFFTKFNSPKQKLNLSVEFNAGNNLVLTVERK